jgi:hypothetical protein
MASRPALCWSGAGLLVQIQRVYPGLRHEMCPVPIWLQNGNREPASHCR